MTNVRFLGAAREVTGSMHLVETPQGKILIDCGFHQGKRDESRRRNAHLPKEALGADAVILTHAHIDHSGSLPTLVKNGYGGAIWSTTATRDLCALLLRDSARIQESDAKWLNRKFGDQPDWTPIEPIYNENDAIHALSRFMGVSYSLPFSPLPGVTARFIDAGHILGSAQVVLEFPDGKRLVFSGDLGRRGLPILRDPEPPGRADYLFMESTYGNRAHGSMKEMHDDLERVIKHVCEKKGKLIIPAFAVGRTQEIVYALNQLYREGRIPEIPVFVDSPLSVHATEVFKLHPECYDIETRTWIENHGDAFSFKSLRYVESKEESMQLNTMKGPFIVVSASGMCEAGRVLHHLKNAVDSENNTILIVGYQAMHTLGRRLIERRPKVKILGVERDLYAQVVVMNAFSAHGDKNDLRQYAHAAEGARRIFLIHGEPEQQEPLQELLNSEGLHVVVPSEGDVAELD